MFALVNRFIAIQNTLNDLACRADLFAGMRKPLPDVLLYREEDEELGVPRPNHPPQPHRVDAWDYPGSIYSLRDEK